MMLIQIRTRSQVVLYSALRLVAAVLQKLISRKKEKFIPPSVLGNLWPKRTCQSLLTGEIWMVLTIFHGIRTSTSHNTVVLAGPKDLHLQSLIDSTF
jgi:phosphate/sulfate permease